jgi:hypothetical protein
MSDLEKVAGHRGAQITEADETDIRSIISAAKPTQIPRIVSNQQRTGGGKPEADRVERGERDVAPARSCCPLNPVCGQHGLDLVPQRLVDNRSGIRIAFMCYLAAVKPVLKDQIKCPRF